MYTSSTVVTNGRYSYNAYKILNNSPSYISDTSEPNLTSKIYGNLNGLRETFKAQLTKRQYDAIGTVINWALSSTTSLADKMGIVEFRFEGSGSYQGGDPATPQGYNSTKVSLKSIDFTGATTTCTGGKHDLDYATNGFVHAANFHTGKGLYGAMSVIYRNGDILGVFQRASTLPNKMESFDTVAPGTYKFVVGTHPMSGGYKALNLYVLGTTNRDCRPSSTKRRILPALRSRGLTPTVVILPNVDPKVA